MAERTGRQLKLKTFWACTVALILASCAGGSSSGTTTNEAPTATTDVAIAPDTIAPDTIAPDTIAPDTEPEPASDPDDVARDQGKVALCMDGGYSDNDDFSATCSGGDGIDRWLATFGECNDGRIIAMNASASCRDNDDFRGLKAVDFEPSARTSDVALCDDGTFSDNTNFTSTCSSAGGVTSWLADYVECGDGTVITLDETANCSDGVVGLRPDYEPPATTAPVPLTLEETIAAEVDRSTFVDEVQGVLIEGGTLSITLVSSDSLTEGLRKNAARYAITDSLEAARDAQLPPEIAEVVVVVRFDLINSLGEVNQENVIVATYTRDTLDRVVFDNIDRTLILTLARQDILGVNPVFAKGDGS